MKSPSYSAIQQFVLKHNGFVAQTCWIADVKASLGYDVRTAANRQGTGRVKPCPPEKRAAIERAIMSAGR